MLEPFKIFTQIYSCLAAYNINFPAWFYADSLLVFGINNLVAGLNANSRHKPAIQQKEFIY